MSITQFYSKSATSKVTNSNNNNYKKNDDNEMMTSTFTFTVHESDITNVRVYPKLSPFVDTGLAMRLCLYSKVKCRHAYYYVKSCFVSPIDSVLGYKVEIYDANGCRFFFIKKQLKLKKDQEQKQKHKNVIQDELLNEDDVKLLLVLELETQTRNAIYKITQDTTYHMKANDNYEQITLPTSWSMHNVHLTNSTINVHAHSTNENVSQCSNSPELLSRAVQTFDSTNNTNVKRKQQQQQQSIQITSVQNKTSIVSLENSLEISMEHRSSINCTTHETAECTKQTKRKWSLKIGFRKIVRFWYELFTFKLCYE